MKSMHDSHAYTTVINCTSEDYINSSNVSPFTVTFLFLFFAVKGFISFLFSSMFPLLQ